MTATAQWIVTGTNSHVRILNGGTMVTGAYDHQITGTVYNGGTYWVTHDKYSNLGWGGNGLLEPTSNFVIDNADMGTSDFKDTVSYGNLIIKQGTTGCRGGTTGFEIKGTLKVEGGSFSGGLTEDQTLSIAAIQVSGGIFEASSGGANVVINMSGNILVSSGFFRGSTGSGQVTINNCQNLTVKGGYFYGSTGSARTIYNILGDVSISSWFFGVHRASGDLPYNVYNVGGSFSANNYYYAVNAEQVGYPTLNFTGAGKTISFGNLSTTQARHTIDFSSGSSYTMQSDLPFYNWMQFRARGTLDAGNYQVKAIGANTSFGIWGTFKTARANGFSGASNTAISNENSPSLTLYSGCTIEYTSASAQAITSRDDYKNLTLSGSGTKTISGATTVANSFLINAPLTISANVVANGNIAINSPVSIGSYNLNINAGMSGTSFINGGNLVIGGSGSQLDLVTCTVSSITVNRSNGCRMWYGDVSTGSLALNGGSFSIGAYTLTISGDLSGTGNLIGGSDARLTVSGIASRFNIPSGMQLHTLTITRTNGCQLAGTLTLRNLEMNDRTLIVGANTLNLSGTMQWTTGSLSVNDDSVINLTGTTSDLSLYPINTGSLILNRSGKTCTLGGTTTLKNLTLSSGTLSIGANTLTIAGTMAANSGQLRGGGSSTMLLASGATDVNIPSVFLNFYTQLCSSVNVVGSLQVNNLNLVNGTLNLGSNSLYIYTSIMQPLIGEPNVSILGSSGGAVYLNTTSDTIWDLHPTIDVSTFSLDTPGGCRFLQSSTIHNTLYLNNGSLNPNGKLSLGNGCLIDRAGGTLVSEPMFGGFHRLNYRASLNTGPEFSASQGMLQELSIMGGNLTVNAQNNAAVLFQIILAPECILNMGDYTLTLEPMTQIMSMPNALILGLVVKDIGDQGINAPAMGVSIAPGVEISGFSCNLQAQSQIYGSSEGILRTWNLEGEYSGNAQISFAWDHTADNGIVFSPLNRAILYRRSGGVWRPVGSPIDVSLMNPRVITVDTEHFSEWTVGSEDNTLPLTLASFTATINAVNTVSLQWSTHSETNLLGFGVYRNTEQDFASAIAISPLIPAANSSTANYYLYVDSEIIAPCEVFYWLTCTELDGAMQVFDPLQVILTNQPDEPPTPPQMKVWVEIYPNPFNPDLNIRIHHPEDEHLILQVFNSKGEMIATLIDRYYSKGIVEATWRGLDSFGKPCGSGVYLLAYSSGGQRYLRKITLSK